MFAVTKDTVYSTVVKACMLGVTGSLVIKL